jgi:6-phosphogluconolactonase
VQVEVLPDLAAASRRAAALVAAEARAAVTARSRFVLAVSGAATARPFYRALAEEDLPWDRVHLFQVDERVAPAGHEDRNFTSLVADLVARAPLPPGQVHPMPVEAPDLAAAAAAYADELAQVAGGPPVIDVVHLGVGTDGHTASLVPGDPVLDVVDADVAVTDTYQGRRRMTLTFPALDRARRILWVIEGAAKAEAFARLRAGDRDVPAGRVRGERAIALVDAGAAGRG